MHAVSMQPSNPGNYILDNSAAHDLRLMPTFSATAGSKAPFIWRDGKSVCEGQGGQPLKFCLYTSKTIFPDIAALAKVKATWIMLFFFFLQ